MPYNIDIAVGVNGFEGDGDNGVLLLAGDGGFLVRVGGVSDAWIFGAGGETLALARLSD